jgi:hypothetical protein
MELGSVTLKRVGFFCFPLKHSTHTDLDDDDPFIVLTETKFSIRYIPVWARYSPLRTRVEAHAITLSP